MSDSTRPLTDIDPLDQDMRFDDFRRCEQIRQAGGIAWSPAHGGFWAVADFELVRKIALDHTRFRSEPGVRVPPNGTPPTFALEYDRPVHTAHRGILTEAVGPRTAPTLDGQVRGHARRLLDGATDGRLDLVSATPFSSRST